MQYSDILEGIVTHNNGIRLTLTGFYMGKRVEGALSNGTKVMVMLRWLMK
jgi:hypothetical protein